MEGSLYVPQPVPALPPVVQRNFEPPELVQGILRVPDRDTPFVKCFVIKLLSIDSPLGLIYSLPKICFDQVLTPIVH